MPYIPSDEMCDEFIPPGTYRVKIVSVFDKDKDGNIKKDKNDDEFWSFYVALQEGTGFIGEQIIDNLFFSGNASSMRRTKDILKKFGIDTSAGMKFDDPKELIDRQAKAEIEISEYKGNKKNVVKYFGGYYTLNEQLSEPETNKIPSEPDKNEIPF